MRLIDADKFIEYLGLDAENSREDNLGEIVTLEDFDRQPTAYDVDKVVEQLEQWSFEAKILIPTNNELGEYEEEVEREVICTKNAIEIAKGGGVDG